MFTRVRLPAIAVLVASFVLAGPMPAEAAPTIVGHSPGATPNEGSLLMTFSGAGFTAPSQTDRVVLYLRNDLFPTVGDEDLNNDDTLDCLEPASTQTTNSPRCRIGSIVTIGATSMQVLFNVDGIAPTDEWRVMFQDAADARSFCETDQTPCLTVTGLPPTISSVSSPTRGTPPRAGQGAAVFAVTITGQNFHDGTTIVETLADPDDRIQISNIVLTRGAGSDPDTIPAMIALSENAAVNDDVITLTNTSGESVAVDLDILPGPKITSFTPSTRGRGFTGAIAVAGTGFHSVTPTTFTPAGGSGVTVNSTTIINSTTASVNLTIASGAPVGPVQFLATNPSDGGRGTATPLTILSDISVLSVSPDAILDGVQNKTLTISGSDLRPSPTITFSPTDIIAFDDAGANLIVAGDGNSLSFRVDSLAGADPDDVVTITVDPGDGGPTGAVEVTILEAPTVTTFSPTQLGQGAVDAPLDILGSSLSPSYTYAFSGTGVTVGGCSAIAGGVGCLTSVASDATLASRTLTITPSGEDPVTIISPTLAIGPSPTLTGTDPTSLGRGAVDRAFAVLGTNLIDGPGLSVNLGSGVAITGCDADADSVDCLADVASDAALTPRTVSVVNGDYGRASCCSVPITEAPSILSASPDQIARGGTLIVTFTGTNLQDATSLDLGSGITAIIQSANATQVVAELTAASDAALGPRPVTVVADNGGRSTCPSPCMTVVAAPTLTSVTPDDRGQGANDAVVTLGGTGRSAASVPDFGPGITIVSTNFTGSVLEVTIDIDLAAATGPRDVSFRNPDGGVAVCDDCFTVNPTPTLTGFTPSTVGRGAEDFQIVANGTGFLPGATVDLGPGVTATVTDVTATTIRMLVDVASSALLGERDSSVSNNDGGVPGTCSAATQTCLTIADAPTVISFTPSSRGQGAQAQQILIDGSGFVTGASASFGPGITTTTTELLSPTQLRATINVAQGATTGARSPTVVNGDGGRTTVIDGFAVNPGPDIDSATPNEIDAGSNTVTACGTALDPGATITVSGSGVTVTGIAAGAPGCLTLTISVTSGAVLGLRDVTVVNPDGGRRTFDDLLEVVSAVPNVTFSSTGRLTEGARAGFSASVTGVTTNNLRLTLRDGGAIVSETVGCFNASGAPVNCGSTSVRRARVNPVRMLVPGEYYRLTVNPPGQTPMTDVDDAQALPTQSFVFRAARHIQDLHPVMDYAWEVVRTPGALGGRELRERLGGARVLATFVGDEVTWHTRIGRDQGVAWVSVDGEFIAEADNSTAGPASRFERTYRGFGPGLHTIAIYVRQMGGHGGGGSYVTVDAIEDQNGLRGSPVVTERWSLVPSNLVTSQSISRAAARGQDLRLPFRGTSISIVAVEGPQQGVVQLVVDGVVRRTLDLSATRTALRSIGVRGLSDAPHTLRILVLGQPGSDGQGRLVSIDRLAIY